MKLKNTIQKLEILKGDWPEICIIAENNTSQVVVWTDVGSFRDLTEGFMKECGE